MMLSGEVLTKGSLVLYKPIILQLLRPSCPMLAMIPGPFKKWARERG